MKKLILFLMVGIFLVSLVGAEECIVARPYYGSVNCEQLEGWSDDIFLGDNEEWTCEIPNCEIVGLDRDEFSCSSWLSTRELIVKVDGITKIQCDNTIGGTLSTECAENGLNNYELRNGQTINVNFNCKWPSSSPEGDPKLKVHYRPIKLRLYFDSGRGFIDNTEFCNANTVWDKYKEKQLFDNSILKQKSISDDVISPDSSEALDSIPSTGNKLEPKQLSIDESYWFIYDWVERPSLMVDYYNNIPVWCSPIDHSLTKLEEIKTRGNDCYLIPTNRLSTIVECCSSDECKGQYTNQGIFCTDDFKCGFEKSCVSDANCGGTSERCQEENGKYYLVKSFCDKSELDSYNKGSCQSKKEEVKCCSGNDGGPNTCRSGSYCNYDKGCIEVTYKSSKGEIKTGVQGEETLLSEKSSGITGAVIGVDNSSTGTIILIIFLILIGGSIGFFFYVKNKKKTKSRPKEKKTEPEEKVPKGKHCTKCGSPLREESKFCTKCGEGVKR